MNLEDTPVNGDPSGYESISQNNTKKSFLSFFDSDIVKAIAFLLGTLGSLFLILLFGVVSVSGSLYFIGNLLNAPIKDQMSAIKVQVNSIEQKFDSIEVKLNNMDKQNKAIIEGLKSQGIQVKYQTAKDGETL